jgi:hypothetical protein
MLGRTTRRKIATAGVRPLIALSVILALSAGVAVAHKGFFIRGAELTRQADGSWTGHGVLDGVKGTLTVTGQVELLKQEMHKIHFTWVAGKRRVSGCAYEEVLTRPHGVQLWDGIGQITKTSAKERKYKGVHVSMTGPTQADDLEHAKLSIGEDEHSGHSPTRDC